MDEILCITYRGFPGKRGGFVDVPYSPLQVVDKPGQPCLGIDDMTTALAAGLSAIVEYTGKDDEHTVGGALHSAPTAAAPRISKDWGAEPGLQAFDLRLSWGERRDLNPPSSRPGQAGRIPPEPTRVDERF